MCGGVISILFLLVMFVGCKTLQDRLMSPDPDVVFGAECELEHIVTESSQWNAGASKGERIGAIKLIKNPDVLLRILTTDLDDGRFNGGYWNAVFRTEVEFYGPCIDGLDQRHLLEFILSEEGYIVNDNPDLFRSVLSDHWYAETGTTIPASYFENGAFVRKDKLRKEYLKKSTWKRSPRLWYALSKLTDDEYKLACFNQTNDSEVRRYLWPFAYRHIDSVDDELIRLYLLKQACARQEKLQKKLDDEAGDKAWKQIDIEYVVSEDHKRTIISGITRENLLRWMLDKSFAYFCYDMVILDQTIKMLPEDESYKIAVRSLDGHTYSSWEHNDIFPFQVAYLTCKNMSDKNKKNVLLEAMIGKIKSYYELCVESKYRYYWIEADRKRVRQILECWGSDLPNGAKEVLRRLSVARD